MIKNLLSVYGVQIYSVVITILFTPVLLTLVGADGFGLIGFFLVIQTVLQILDGGISGSLSRQAGGNCCCCQRVGTTARSQAASSKSV